MLVVVLQVIVARPLLHLVHQHHVAVIDFLSLLVLVVVFTLPFIRVASAYALRNRWRFILVAHGQLS